MPDLEQFSRPLRRVLTEWLSRLIDRLLDLQYQLRHGVIRLISTSVAETIEHQLHRPFSHRQSSEPYDDYLDYDDYSDALRLAYSPAPESTYSSHAGPGWRSALFNTTNRLLQWLQKPWVEPMVAGCVTLVSLLLLVG